MRSHLAENFDRPVFVYGYPAEIKAFYMQPDPNRPEVVLAATYWPLKAMAKLLVEVKEFTIMSFCGRADCRALICRKRTISGTSICGNIGSVPHSGFGLGLERTVAWICGLPHVRETIPFAPSAAPYVSIKVRVACSAAPLYMSFSPSTNED